MSSMCSEGKSVVAEIFIRTLKNTILKNYYVDKLDGIVNKYNNTYSTIKMKPVDVKLNIH